jgi:mono/diheme cytochrome c family protein
MHGWRTITAVVMSAGMLACPEGSSPQGGQTGTTAPGTPAATAPAQAAPGGAAPSEAARKEAEQIFATRCFTCHGPTGKGDGPASQGLTPPPRNFHDPAWQASVTDEHIEKIIKFGGAAVGKSPAMPPNPDLMSKAEIVAALRHHIRELKD